MQLKKLSKEGVDAALEKAIRYRLLNEPMVTESICIDILEVDPANQQTIVTLLLSITDQFGSGKTMNHARQLLPKLDIEYDRLYYGGIICERMGKSVLKKFSTPRMDDVYKLLREAMVLFEQAEKIRPKGNDDTILRWNTCARIITKHNLTSRKLEEIEEQLE